jgi:hypothetical protein
MGGSVDGLRPGVGEDVAIGKAEDELLWTGEACGGREKEDAAGEHHCMR